VVAGGEEVVAVASVVVPMVALARRLRPVSEDWAAFLAGANISRLERRAG